MCDGDSDQPQPGNEGGQDDSSAKVLATGIEVASQEEGDVVVLLLHDVQLELHQHVQPQANPSFQGGPSGEMLRGESRKGTKMGDEVGSTLVKVTGSSAR